MALFHKNKNDYGKKILSDILSLPRYHALGAIGEGGIAEVQSCFDAFLNRVVAVKKLKPDALENEDLIKSFINEALLIGYLDHPGIISIFDTFVLSENRLSYSMKFIEGVNVSTELAQPRGMFSSAFAQGNVMRILGRLCETLQHAHDRGVIHLDIKPDNIMLCPYGQVVMMDWGNARIYDPQPYTEFVNAFAPGINVLPFLKEPSTMVLGTPSYMSPEQTNTPRSMLTPASDIFSLGIVLYEMLCGISPFADPDATIAMENVRSRVVTPPHEINHDIPRRLSQICCTMMEKDRSRRYASLHDVQRDLADLQNSGQAFSLREFAAGETIFSEGDEGHFACTIVSGSVEVAKKHNDTNRVLAVLGRGEIVGELAIFSKEPRSATVTAREPTRVRIIEKTDIDSELEKLNPWVGVMITALSRRFNNLNERFLEMARGSLEQSVISQLRSDMRKFEDFRPET